MVVTAFANVIVSKCPFCRTFLYGYQEAIVNHPEILSAPLLYLKRIPPLSELEGARTEETLHLPNLPTKEPA